MLLCSILAVEEHRFWTIFILLSTVAHILCFTGLLVNTRKLDTDHNEEGCICILLANSAFCLNLSVIIATKQQLQDLYYSHEVHTRTYTYIWQSQLGMSVCQALLAPD